MGTCHRVDLSVAPSRDDEHDTRDTMRLCKDTMREDAMELGDPLASICALTHRELKIAQRVAVYNPGDLYKISRVDVLDEERRKRKEYHRVFASIVQMYSRKRAQRKKIRLKVSVDSVQNQNEHCFLWRLINMRCV